MLPKVGSKVPEPRVYGCLPSLNVDDVDGPSVVNDYQVAACHPVGGSQFGKMVWVFSSISNELYIFF